MAERVATEPEFRAWAERNLGPDRAVEHARRFAARWQSSFPTLDGLLDRIRAIRCPSLHIYGTKDSFGTVSQAERIAAQIPGGQVWLIPGGGHDPHEEMPDAFNHRVLAFFESLS